MLFCFGWEELHKNMPLVGRLLIQGKRLLIIIQPILITISTKSTEESLPRQHVELCVYECKYKILQPPPPPNSFPPKCLSCNDHNAPWRPNRRFGYRLAQPDSRPPFCS